MSHPRLTEIIVKQKRLPDNSPEHRSLDGETACTFSRHPVTFISICVPLKYRKLCRGEKHTECTELLFTALIKVINPLGDSADTIMKFRTGRSMRNHLSGNLLVCAGRCESLERINHPGTAVDSCNELDRFPCKFIFFNLINLHILLV